MDALLHWLNLDLFQSADLLVVAVLVVLEGLLSCDNAVVLALLVKDLPPAQRGKALRYGIIGAYVFRIIALALAVWIMSKWYLKVAGGIYLGWLALHYFWKKYKGGCSGNRAGEDAGPAAGDHAGSSPASSPSPLAAHTPPPAREPRRLWRLSAFWSVVVWVELTDIVFSVDSIAAAVALSDKLWVLILGGLLGILAMRFAAQGFVSLLERFPRLESCAFAAVGVIGLKLILELPVDLVTPLRPLPAEAAYRDAAGYVLVAERARSTWIAIPHVLTINRAAPVAPDPAVLRAGAEAAAPAALAGPERSRWVAERSAREQRGAEAAWNLGLRPFIELEGWVSSLVVLAIFAVGFIRRPAAKRDGNTGC